MTTVPDEPDDLVSLKTQLRKRIREARKALPNKTERSRVIFGHIERLPEWQAARTVLIYVDVHSEVRTRGMLDEWWSSGKRLVMPVCEGTTLKLFELRALDELVPSGFQLLEPDPKWQTPDRFVTLDECDLALVPAVGFDRQGNRLGHGVGHYDRLLANTPPTLPLIGIAFDCQIIDTLPAEPHDVPMTMLATESGITQCPPPG
jgi:5-formyltetrahydrofolate cyclo-ligase